MTNGEKLKTAREAKGYSLDELAEKTGINTSTIYRIEHGKSKPHGITLRALAKALGVKMEELR